MKFRGTIIALLVAAGLFGYLLISERRSTENASSRARLQQLIPADEFASLTFTRSGKHVALHKRGDSWVISHPVSAPVDPERIATFVDTLRAARIEEQVGAGNLERYGLDHPSVELHVEAPDGTKTRVRFGRINPLQTLVYVLVDDSPQVKLTTSALLTYSLTSDFGWRDKHMVAELPENIARMTMRTTKSGSLTVRRDAVVGWVAEDRTPWRVDPLRMTSVLRTFAQLDAVGVGAENKSDAKKYGLASSRMRVKLEREDGSIAGDVVFGFARGEGTYYATVPDKPEVFEVSGELVDRYVSFVRDFRDRKLFPTFKIDDVTRVEVSAPKDTFAVERRSRSQWVVVRSTTLDSTFALDPSLLQGMLENLATMNSSEFPKQQPDPAKASETTIRITLLGENGWVSGLEVGARDPGGLHSFVRGTHDRVWVLAAPTLLINLPFDLERYGTEEAQVEIDSNRG